LIFLLTRSDAGRYDRETLVIVIFKQSLELTFSSSGKGFGLSQKEESGGIRELNEVIERMLIAFTIRYVLFDRIENHVWTLSGFGGSHLSKLLINEVIR